MKKPIALMIGEWLSSCPRWQLFFVFAVFGLTVYAGAILHPFVHDDIFFLVENPIFKHFDLQKIFLHPLDMSVISVGVNAYYRPLLDVVNYAQYQAYGFDPHAFHLFNIILHIINSFLVFNLLVRILRLCPNLTRESGRWMALFASVIFMIHPVQTQAVDCVSGISNLLFVFFGLLAFLMYLEFRQENASIKTNILYVLSLITLMLALLSKEQALVFPLLAAWFEVCYFRNSSRTSPGKAVLCVGGWLAMAIAYVLWKKSLMGSEPLLGGHLFTPEFWLRAAHIPQIILINISLILAPHEFHYFRSVDILTPYVPAMIV